MVEDGAGQLRVKRCARQAQGAHEELGGPQGHRVACLCHTAVCTCSPLQLHDVELDGGDWRVDGAEHVGCQAERPAAPRVEQHGGSVYESSLCS